MIQSSFDNLEHGSVASVIRGGVIMLLMEVTCTYPSDTHVSLRSSHPLDLDVFQVGLVVLSPKSSTAQAL